MKSNSLRSFALGLLVSAVVFAAVYYMGPSETESSQTVKAASEDEMKIALSDKGYVIQTEEEWNQQQTALEEAKKKATETPVAEAPAETETAQYHAMLSVSE